MADMQKPALAADDRNRAVDEARILDYLLLYGWAGDVQVERELARREARAALDRATDLGLPCVRSTAGGRRRFDPLEVINFLKWAGAWHGDPFRETRLVATQRALVRAFHSSSMTTELPPAPATLGPRRFTVTLRREFDLRLVASGAHIALRLPLPIEDAALRGLDVEFIVPPGIDIDMRVAPGRLDARFATPAVPAIALGVRMTFVACAWSPDPSPAPLAQADRELYTRPSEGFVRISPRIAALAGKIAGPGRDADAAVTRLWNFLIDELTCGVVDHDALDEKCPLDSVLDSGWFDCQLGSALLVALCRSLGIPARVVGGFLIYPACPAYHWWAEIWQAGRGWVPFDSLCADLSVGGRDEGWRNYFHAQLDYRMKTEILPRFFSHSPGLRMPRGWRILSRADGAATEISVIAAATGATVYRDRIAVVQGPEAA